MEPGYSPDTVALLESAGYTVQVGERAGRSAPPSCSRDGWLEGAADPRTEGTGERILTA